MITFGVKSKVFEPDFNRFLKSKSASLVPVITLTSDYGLTDHHVASVKGTLIKEIDQCHIVDITHHVEPGNFFEAAFVLRNCYRDFPKGTVHLIAVQEISKNGRLLVAEMDDHFFIAADQGIITLINPDVRINKVIEINLRQEKTLFPARDVMAKAASHIIRGGSIDLLGRKITDYEGRSIMRPRLSNNGSVILGSVVYIDNFGNLITNISKKTFSEAAQDRDFEIVLPRRQIIKKIQESYFPSSPGSVIALFNSQNLLEIALSEARGKDYNGANTLLGINVQGTISVNFK